MDLDDYVAQHRSKTADDAPVFLNHAGASIPDLRVVRRIIAHMELERRVGGYAAANAVSEERSSLGVLVGELIGCSPDQVAYVDSGTRAWNAIVYSSLELTRGDNVVTAPSEFGSNLVSLLDVARSAEADVRLAELSASGAIDTDSLVELVDERTKLVAVSILSAHCGVVSNLDGVGDRIRRKNPECILLVDGCQAVGQLPVNISAIGCDAFTATGRKWLRGPRGTGFLYVDKDLLGRLRPPTLDLINADLVLEPHFGASSLSIRTDVKRFESWERSVAVELGFIEALRIVNDLGVVAVNERIAARAKQLRHGLSGAPAFRLLEHADEASGIVGLASLALSADEVVDLLSADGVSIGSMHEWDAPLFFAGSEVESTVRISPSFLNTEDEVDLCLDHLLKIG